MNMTHIREVDDVGAGMDCYHEGATTTSPTAAMLDYPHEMMMSDYYHDSGPSQSVMQQRKKCSAVVKVD